VGVGDVERLRGRLLGRRLWGWLYFTDTGEFWRVRVDEWGLGKKFRDTVKMICSAL